MADLERTGARRLAAALVLLFVPGLIPACRHARPLPSTDAPVILFFGDSITRGQGLREEQAFPAVIQRKLNDEGLDYHCINAGVSGDTTESALSRASAYAAAHPRVVVVELGANDVFRGVNRLRTEENLSHIVSEFTAAGARVIVAGTFFPHLQHPATALSLARVYEQVASGAGAELVGDLTAGVAAVPGLNLADGIHPNAKGHEHLAATLWPVLRRTLDKPS